MLDLEGLVELSDKDESRQVAVEAFPGGPLEVTRDVDAGGIDDIFAEIASKSSK